MAGDMWQSLLSLSATVSTFGLFATGIPICLKIHHRGSSIGVSPLPFLLAVFGCLLWLAYGLMVANGVVILVNLIGALFHLSYLSCYWLYCTDPASVSSLRARLLVLFSTLAAVLFYVMHVLSSDPQSQAFCMGCIGSVSNIVFSASPLADLGHVFRSGSASSLPFTMIAANCVVSAQWLLYGAIIHDPFVTVPNIVGFIICLLQLLLFVIFPSTPKPHSS